MEIVSLFILYLYHLSTFMNLLIRFTFPSFYVLHVSFSRKSSYILLPPNPFFKNAKYSKCQNCTSVFAFLIQHMGLFVLSQRYQTRQSRLEECLTVEYEAHVTKYSVTWTKIEKPCTVMVVIPQSRNPSSLILSGSSSGRTCSNSEIHKLWNLYVWLIQILVKLHAKR